MILTQQKRAPWRWVVYLGLMAASINFAQANAGAPLTFIVKKFVDKPWLILLITGMNQILSMFIAPYISWKTDRIWTRWGRRRPLMILGISLMIVGLVSVPFITNLWVLLAAILIWMVSFDVGYMGVWTPLVYEVVPSQQRGRAQVIRRCMVIPASLFFNYVLISQLDQHYDLSLGRFLARIPILSNLVSADFQLQFTGEHVIFLSGGAVLTFFVAMLVFGLREFKPANALPHEKFSVMPFLRSLFASRQYRMIYLLLFAVACMGASLASLWPLLIRDQWHYNMSQFGKMTAIAIGLEVMIIMPLAASIVDRFDRFKIFQWGLFFSTLHPIAFWLFVKYVAPDQIPSIPWIIGFVMFNAVVDGTAGIALEPLIFDLVPRSQMGTANAGFLLVGRMLGFLVTTCLGFWVSLHAFLFSLPEAPDATGKMAQTYDYMSGYLYVFALGVVGCLIAVYFGHEIKAGRIIMYGKLEDEAHAKQETPEHKADVATEAAVAAIADDDAAPHAPLEEGATNPHDPKNTSR